MNYQQNTDVQELIAQENTHFDDKQFHLLTFSFLFYSVMKRPWIMILILLAVLIPGSFYIFNTPRQFISSAVVMVPVKGFDIYSIDPVFNRNSQAKPEHFYNSILESNNYRSEVSLLINELHSEIKPDSLARFVLPGDALDYDTDPRQPGLITIYGRSEDGRKAEVFTEVALLAFQQIISRLDRQDAQSVVDFIESQLVAINLASIEAEEALQNFLNEKNFIVGSVEAGVSSELIVLQNHLLDAEANLEMTNLNILSFEERIQTLIDSISTERSENEVQEFANRRARLNEIRGLLSNPGNLSQVDSMSLATEKNEIVRELIQSYAETDNSQSRSFSGITLQNLEEELEEATLDHERFRNEVQFYTIQINRFRNEHPNLSEDILEYTRLSRARDVLTTTLEILLEQRETARIQVASQLGGIRIIDPPRNAAPIARRTIQKFLILFFLATAFGVAVSYFVARLNLAIEDEQTVLSWFGVHVFGSIPRIPAKDKERTSEGSTKSAVTEKQNKLLFNYPENSQLAEAYRSVKTSLMFQSQDNDRKMFVISSPSPGEGKSITTANIAISIAQGGKKVLVIDLDLRRPTQHRLWNLERKPGITNYLFNEVEIDQVIRQTELKDLHVIPAGFSPPNPAELLNSNRIKRLLAELREQYDCILIDTPPVISCVDSRLIASVVDGIILIAKAEYTPLKTFRFSLDLLRKLDVNILGVVLNHIQKRYSRMYYYTYRYTNPYNYYGSYNYYYTYSSNESLMKEEDDDE